MSPGCPHGRELSDSTTGAVASDTAGRRWGFAGEEVGQPDLGGPEGPGCGVSADSRGE